MDETGRCCAPSAPPGAPAGPGASATGAARVPPDSGLVALGPATFRMGSDAGLGHRGDGEGPAREVRLGAFSIAARAVTVAHFDDFVLDTGYQTVAERCGWSFVFKGQLGDAPSAIVKGISSDAPWWVAVEGACWSRPEGPGSGVGERADHPVTHVAWSDAAAYCRWSGTRLPSEAEWEYAARGGLEECVYPWGDELTPGGVHRCNIWQGEFPERDRGDDGFTGTAPACAYQPNGHGLFNVSGNVWEWCADWFSPNYHRVTRAIDPRYLVPTGRRAMRGGSFLCHAAYCNRYRVAARGSNTPGSTTSHCGFRVAL